MTVLKFSFPLRLFLCVFLFLNSAVAVRADEADNAAGAQAAEAAFIQRLVEKDGFSADQVRGWLDTAQVRDSILQTMSQPPETRSWPDYRAGFMTEARIRAGVNFWQNNAGWLNLARCEYGVEPQYIVAILGVETFYGRQTGRYPILDALVTLGFHFPPRQQFFQDELEQFLLLAREEHMDPLAHKGSYAGAMGIPQFMPSSYRRWAVDLNRDGVRDIWGEPADAIGSVANYFRSFGWQSGGGFLLPVTVQPSDQLSALMQQPFTERRHTLAEWGALGVDIGATTLPPDTPAWLFSLDDGEQQSWYLGLNNYFVLTRYNRSVYYATTVFQLAQALQQAVVPTVVSCN